MTPRRIKRTAAKLRHPRAAATGRQRMERIQRRARKKAPRRQRRRCVPAALCIATLCRSTESATALRQSLASLAGYNAAPSSMIYWRLACL